MFQRKRTKAFEEEMEKQHAAVEAYAGSLLEELKGSKWTAAILLAAGALATAVLWSLF